MPDFRRIGENIMKGLGKKKVALLIEQLEELRDAAKDKSYDFTEDKSISRIYTGKADAFDVAISFIKTMAGEKNEETSDVQD